MYKKNTVFNFITYLTIFKISIQLAFYNLKYVSISCFFFFSPVLTVCLLLPEWSRFLNKKIPK